MCEVIIEEQERQKELSPSIYDVKYDFPNLAVSKKNIINDAIVFNELVAAGIQPFNLLSEYGECRVELQGTILGWIFQRAWRYWICSGPGIPVKQALELNEKHGKEVRVDGHAAGLCPKKRFKGLGCGHYHVDTQEGLIELVKTIKKCCEG